MNVACAQTKINAHAATVTIAVCNDGRQRGPIAMNLLVKRPQLSYALDNLLGRSIRGLIIGRAPVARKFENLRSRGVENFRHRGARTGRTIGSHHRAARSPVRDPIIEIPLHHYKVHVVIHAMVIQLLE